MSDIPRSKAFFDFCASSSTLIVNNIHLRKRSSKSTGLLRTEVEGLVLLALVEFPEVLALLLVNYCENSGDALADRVDAGELARRATCHLLHSELEKLLLELLELLGEVRLGLALELVCLDLRL